MAEDKINHYNIITWNANGLTDRREELESFMNTENIDIALISETRLKPESHITFCNYTLLRTDHPSGNSQGGTAVILKNHIKHRPLKPYQTEELQATSIKLLSQNSETTIAAIYCAPNHKIETDVFKLFFGQLGPVFICGGDWNAKHTMWGSRLINSRGKILHKAILDLDLKPLSSREPTFCSADSNKTPDLLDFFIVRIPRHIRHEVKNCSSLSSDHTPVYLNISFEQRKPRCTSIIARAKQASRPETENKGQPIRRTKEGNVRAKRCKSRGDCGSAVLPSTSTQPDKPSNVVNNEEWITRKIVEMIASDNLPFKFLDGSGFRELLKGLAPSYHLQNGNHFKELTEDVYDTLKSQVKREIKKYPYLPTTASIRKDPRSKNKLLLILTGHGITEKFERFSILLKCCISDDNSITEDIVASKLKHVVKDELYTSFEIVHCIIRDETSSLLRGRPPKLSTIQDLDCTAHKIQTIVRETFVSEENIQHILTNIKNKYPDAEKELQEIQNIQKKYIDNKTNIIEQFSFIFCRLTKIVMKYENLELAVAEQLDEKANRASNLIYKCTNKYKSSSHPQLLSSVIPNFNKIVDSLENYLKVLPDSNVLNKAVLSLKKGFEAALSTFQEDTLPYEIATFLDPLFKNKLSPEIKKKCKDFIIMENTASTSELDNFDSEMPNTKRIRLQEQEEEKNALGVEKTDNSKFEKELEEYDKITLRDSEDPLEWWKKNCNNKFKNLSVLARRFLSPPASVVNDDKLFRNFDLTFEREEGEEEKLLFIKHNAPKFDYNIRS